MRLKKYHQIIANTPPEVKKKVSDWMDKMDREHKDDPEVNKVVIWGVLNTPFIDNIVNRKEE